MFNFLLVLSTRIRVSCRNTYRIAPWLGFLLWTCCASAFAQQPGYAGKLMRFAHGAAFQCLAFSPDGQSLATGDASGVIMLSNVANGRLRQTVRTGLAGIRSLAYSSNGQLLAVGDANGRVDIRRASNGDAVRQFEHGRAVLALAFNASDELLAVGGGESASVWAVNSGSRTHTLTESNLQEIEDVKFGDRGTLVVAEPGAVEGHSLGADQTTKLLWSGKAHARISLAPGAELYALWDYGQYAQVGRVMGRELSRYRDLVGQPGTRAVAFEPAPAGFDAWMATLGTDNTIRVWTIKSGYAHHAFALDKTEVMRRIAVSPGGRWVATVSGPIDRGSLRLWDTQRATTVPPSIDIEMNSDARGQARIENRGGGIGRIEFLHDGSLAGTYEPLNSTALDYVPPNWDSYGPEVMLSFGAPLLVGHALEVRAYNASGTRRSSKLFKVEPPQSPAPSRDDELRLELPLRRGRFSRVALSPGGELLATVADERAFMLWEVSTARPIRGLIMPASLRVGTFTFSHGGTLLAVTGKQSPFVGVWDVRNGRMVASFVDHEDSVMAFAFSAQDDKLVTASRDGTSRIWSIKSGEQLKTVKIADAKAESASVSADGRVVAMTDAVGVTHLVDTQSKKARTALQKDSGNVVAALSPHGRHLAMVRPGYLAIWDVAARRLRAEYALDIRSLAFSPNERELVVWKEGGGPTFLSAESPSQQRSLGRQSGQQGAVAFAASRELVASSAGEEVLIFDANGGREVARIQTYGGGIVGSVSVSASGRYLAVGHQQSGVWDLSAGAEMLRYGKPGDTIRQVQFSAKIDDLLMDAHPLALRNLQTGAPVGKLAEGPEAGGNFVLSPDGRFVAEAYGHGAQLWDTATGQPYHRFTGGSMNVVAISPAENLLATASGLDALLFKFSSPTKRADGSLAFELTSTPEARLEHTDAVSDLAFSPNGLQLLSGTWKGLYLWEVASGSQAHSYPHSGAVSSVAFSRDGRLVAAGDFGGGLHVWEAQTARLVYELIGHTAEISDVAFGDGWVASASWDGTVRLWNLDNGRELCRLVSFSDGTWFVISPDGRFDTNNLEHLDRLSWVVSDDPLHSLSGEIFMRDYYEPRLLARLLAGEKLPPIRNIAGLNRVQPRVDITRIVVEDAALGTVSVSVRVAPDSREFRAEQTVKTVRTDVYDLRLFRNGQRVAQAPASQIHASPASEQALEVWRRASKIELGASATSTEVTFRGIRLPRAQGAEQVEFSAYAFNADRVKSATARRSITIPGEAKRKRGKVFLLAVGVSAFEDPRWDLKYAANDAQLMWQVLGPKLRALVSAGDRDGFEALLLTSTRARNGAQIVDQRRATKANIRASFDLLAGREVPAEVRARLLQGGSFGPARPEDVVLITVSTHGYRSDAGTFYLLPEDIGPSQASVAEADLRARAISSEELTSWLEGVDAEDIALIVDACHSAATVEVPGFKPGPMGSRGLGQLAYDKGMRILAASESDDVAIESGRVRHGLLSYGLVHDGLELSRADFRPKDGQVWLSEWLRYGERRVPSLHDELRRGAVDGSVRAPKFQTPVTSPTNSYLQHPVLFDFSRARRPVALTPDQRSGR